MDKKYKIIIPAICLLLAAGCYFFYYAGSEHGYNQAVQDNNNAKLAGVTTCINTLAIQYQRVGIGIVSGSVTPSLAKPWEQERKIMEDDAARYCTEIAQCYMDAGLEDKAAQEQELCRRAEEKKLQETEEKYPKELKEQPSVTE